MAAFLPDLYYRAVKRTLAVHGQVWDKLPDMPYSSLSINHYQDSVNTLGGSYEVEWPDEHNLVF